MKRLHKKKVLKERNMREIRLGIVLPYQLIHLGKKTARMIVHMAVCVPLGHGARLFMGREIRPRYVTVAKSTYLQSYGESRPIASVAND
jgi:hypothetical protein